jgi:hypothetical protein
MFFGSSFELEAGLSLRFHQNTSVTSFGGSGNPLPPGVTTENMYFMALANGNWSTGVDLPSDFGTNGAWTQGPSGVPEPSTLALAAFGGATLFFLRFRRPAA